MFYNLELDVLASYNRNISYEQNNSSSSQKVEKSFRLLNLKISCRFYYNVVSYYYKNASFLHKRADVLSIFKFISFINVSSCIKSVINDCKVIPGCLLKELMKDL